MQLFDNYRKPLFEMMVRYCISMLCVISSLCSPALVMANEAQYQAEQGDIEQPVIRVVMSAAFVSEAGVEIYDEIFHYLGQKLDLKIDFITGFSYTTINSMIDNGMVDIGFICGLPYVMKHDQPDSNIGLLVAPVMQVSKYNDKPVYYSYVIVHKDSMFKNFLDLRGSLFVYNDEISNSGYNMPRGHLIGLGETNGFFSNVIRSGSHEESIRMVALGEADVSAVDSLVYDYDMKKNPEYVAQTRIVETLGPAGIPPVVFSKEMPLNLREKVRQTLIGMKDDPQGRLILDKALVDRFEIANDSNYDGIRMMKEQALKTGYLKIK